MRSVTPNLAAKLAIKSGRAESSVNSGSIDHGDSYPFSAQLQGESWGVFDARDSSFTPAAINTAAYAETVASGFKKKLTPAPGSAAQYNPKGA